MRKFIIMTILNEKDLLDQLSDIQETKKQTPMKQPFGGIYDDIQFTDSFNGEIPQIQPVFLGSMNKYEMFNNSICSSNTYLGTAQSPDKRQRADGDFLPLEQSTQKKRKSIKKIVQVKELLKLELE